MRRYFHTVIIDGDALEPGQDLNGNLKPTQPGQPTILQGRYEPLDSIKEVQTSDGNVVLSKGVIFLPKKAPDVAIGKGVEITGVIKANALYFRRGLFNCELYV